MKEHPVQPQHITESNTTSEAQGLKPTTETEEFLEDGTSFESPQRPDYFFIDLSNFNARNRARITISGSEDNPSDIYLIASKDFEDDEGFFKYDVQAYRGVPAIEGGSEARVVDNEVGLGLFDSREMLKSFIDDNPEIRQAADKVAGNIEPVNQQYGYGFMICKYPEHESRPGEFII